MSLVRDITPLVLTFNEEANIGRTLERLEWASRVVVLDSFSTDRTLEICAAHANVEVVQRRFDDHTSQWNFGLAQVHSPWVLSLDADYVLTESLVAEFDRLEPAGAVDGYAARFEYCVFGRSLRASLYPPRVVLFRRDRATFVVDGHTQRLSLPSEAAWLDGRIQHDDRKPMDRWLSDQMRYAAIEARHLADAPASELAFQDRLRRQIVWAPLVVAGYALVWRRLMFDGWPGFYYTLQRVTAEIILSLRLLDARLRRAVRGDAAR
jgi:glycosyltransferase involved in cell wall biosynthesis